MRCRDAWRRRSAPGTQVLAVHSAGKANRPFGDLSQALALSFAMHVSQLFLFDGRMRGDGARQEAPADAHHLNAGAIVVQPKAEPAWRQR